ncbi:hypothetical protein BMS3Abin10_02188 [bacterium BMS3Abin10]|nr:hypothetical protein BMS3Abin10_02188 [bacterium BMS3Abin10]GBE38747.1 hypothetical protein BMS3Bbin08_01357 [bacterium BMS3Bbin08]
MDIKFPSVIIVFLSLLVSPFTALSKEKHNSLISGFKVFIHSAKQSIKQGG